MPKRNRHRAARRNEARTRKNAAAVAAGVAAAAEAPVKREWFSTKSQLQLLESRRTIHAEHRRAGERLERDYRASMTMPRGLISRYDANTPAPPKAYQGGHDTPAAIDARKRYDDAMKAVGPWLAPILLHTAVLDEPANAWGPLNGRAATHGVPLLVTALQALAHHYASQREKLVA
jgi:hypothetical protein